MRTAGSGLVEAINCWRTKRRRRWNRPCPVYVLVLLREIAPTSAAFGQVLMSTKYAQIFLNSLMQLWLRLTFTHSHRHRIHRVRSLSKGFPDWQGCFHQSTEIQFKCHCFKVWLAGPVLIVVGAVLCGKVMIDWGPAMERGRAGSVDSRLVNEVDTISVIYAPMAISSQSV